MKLNIGLDAMGGDYAPRETVAGAVLAAKQWEGQVEFYLFGRKADIERELSSYPIQKNIHIVDCPEVIEMGEHPTKALPKKPLSSIMVGFDYLKNKKIDAFAGAGNTGAMIVAAMYTVKPIEGIIRPCITSILPKEEGGVNILLDVGANADCKPDVLYQFAILGSIYAKNVLNIDNPRVGLLNIGEEEEKGNMLTQVAYRLMKNSEDFNFVGNVEGRDLFIDKADVIVCDGFTGNVVLKTAEAFYTLIKKRNLEDDYFKRFNFENYGGTPILGINAPVIVGHGISNASTISNMLNLAKEVAEAGLSEKIKIALVHE